MQVVISLPDDNVFGARVCGLPLTERVIITAARNGGTEILLLHPSSVPARWIESRLRSITRSASIRLLEVDSFDPERPPDWRSIENWLQPRFLWLPWNYVVTDKKALSRMIEVCAKTGEGVRFAVDGGGNTPLIAVREELMRIGALAHYRSDAHFEEVALAQAPGVAIDSTNSIRQAERELVRRSGKDSDGIYSKSNRWLVRPMVRWLSKTPVTPNVITFGGLGAAAFSGYWFSKGYWAAYVIGALLYFSSVLFDEMDGMLARLKFRESAFGCWLETFVDYAGFLFIFAGMTVGFYRKDGVQSLFLGTLLLFGTIMSFIVLIHQRKTVTDPGRPQEYRGRLRRSLETDSRNIASRLLSRFLWFTEPLARNGAFCYFVFIFAVSGQLKSLFWGIAVGSNLAWMLLLHSKRLFQRPTAILT